MNKYTNQYISEQGLLNKEQYKDKLLTILLSEDNNAGLEAMIRIEKEGIISNSDYIFINKYTKNKAVKEYIKDKYNNQPTGQYNTKGGI